MLYSKGHLRARSVPNTTRRSSWLCLAAAGQLLLAQSLAANTLLWTGGGGANAKWSNSANWGSIGTPGNGDTLIFQGASGLINTNDIPNLTLNQIKFIGASGGFDIHGYNLTLTNSILATNTAGANTIEVTNITLATSDLLIVVSNGVSLTIASQVQGSVGVTKTGAGTLAYTATTPGGIGGNTYTGTTAVNLGLLTITTPAVDGGFGGALVIGDGSGNAATVRLLIDDEIPNNVPVTINSGGLLDLNGSPDTIGTNLTLNGNASITTGVATLNLSSGATVTANLSTFFVGNVTISGNLNVGSGNCSFIVNPPLANAALLTVPANISGTAAITKSGTGFMSLSGANSFSGQMNVIGGILGVSNPLALGSTNGATTVSNTATLQIYASITNESLTIASAGIGIVNASGANTWIGPVTLAAATTFEIDGVSLDLQSTISGSGGFTKTGAGTLTLSGANENTYSGATVVNVGLLQLNKSGFHSIGSSSSITVGDGIGGPDADVVRYINANGNQINAGIPITVNNSGLFDLNGHSDDIGPITFNGGDISTGTGLLQLAPGSISVLATNRSASLSGNVQLFGSPTTMTVADGTPLYDITISANLSDIGGGLVITNSQPSGTHYIRLTGSNSFSGPLTIAQAIASAETPWALGTTNGATTVTNGGTLFLYSTGITNESLTLGPGCQVTAQYDCTWAGPITLAGDATIYGFANFGLFDIRGPISGTGNLTSASAGATNRFSGSAANTYLGTTTVDSGVLELNKAVTDGAIPGNVVINGALRLDATEQITNAADMLINPGGVFDTSENWERIDTLRGSGSVTFGLNGWIEVGLNNGSSTFDGVLSGTGYTFGGYTVAKRGSGTFTMNGNNTFTAGATHVFSPGKLVVNGLQPQIPAIVDSGAIFGGSGTVGTVAASGNLSPGNSPGILTSSNVTFSASGSLVVELTGPTAGSGYDQLNVRGTNILGNAALTVIPSFTTPVAIGQQFVILNNDLTDPITGTFAGLAEGATIIAGGYKFSISYIGGTGNDVVLTVTDIPGAAVASAVTSGDGNHAIDPNECNNLYLVISNKTGSAMNNVSATLSTTSRGVLVTQPYAAYPNLAANGKATNTEPFQISTLPAFTCGTDINLQLSVNSSLGSFTMAFVQHTGEPAGSPTRYDTNAVISIPDVGSIDSTNIVSGFVGPLTKVAVSMYITHTFDSDLTNISLVAPDGTTVLLSSANGGGGQNYGTNCSPDAGRTTFDDAAGTAITSGTAPFTGTFRPQSPLSAFIGNPTPNGNWHLHIADAFGGSLGTLRCWSLFLYGSACTPGGGSCGFCLSPISGSITTNDPVEVTRISRDFFAPPSCATPKGFPGVIDSNLHYDLYTFTNTSGADACATIVLSAACDVEAVAYLNSFNPSDISTNYLADGGDSTADLLGSVVSFSCDVPVGAKLLVVVNEINSNAGCTNYTLQLSGLPCPAPLLNVQSVPTRNARLYWPTAAGGYLLEATPSLVPTNWSQITNEPIVVNGNFNVTNPAATPNTRFYRLHKP